MMPFTETQWERERIMPTVCINKSHTEVRLTGERLIIEGMDPEDGKQRVMRDIPLRDVDRVVLHQGVRVTPPAMTALLRRGIPIGVLSGRGRYLGSFLPAESNHGRSRLQQYLNSRDSERVSSNARAIIEAKIYNQRRVLQRLAASRKREEVEETEGRSPDESSREEISRRALLNQQLLEVQKALNWMQGILESIKRAVGLDEIRGYEGAATARYFSAWARFLPEEYPFEQRSIRPPLNPVNACISFGATLIYGEMVAFLQAHGLDPALGMLHTTENGRWSLALDLMEPFRPALVEALALDLFSHQILDRRHFEERDGGFFLNEEGRGKFFLQYERRMERQFLSEFMGHRTSLRQCLEGQAVMFKTSLEDSARFRPFLMN